MRILYYNCLSDYLSFPFFSWKQTSTGNITINISIPSSALMMRPLFLIILYTSCANIQAYKTTAYQCNQNISEESSNKKRFN